MNSSRSMEAKTSAWTRSFNVAVRRPGNLARDAWMRRASETPRSNSVAKRTSFADLETGLDRFVKLGSNRDLVGRGALERQRAAGLERRMVTLKVDSKDADAYMNEGVYASGGGPLVGRVTSGACSHTLGHSISMACVGMEHSRPGTALEIPLLDEALRSFVARREGEIPAKFT